MVRWQPTRRRPRRRCGALAILLLALNDLRGLVVVAAALGAWPAGR
jgi:hypothetical protein